ncbi:HpcH/HpaI aldolase family protein [Flexithrix dorotheae]|uniref:HpcH/HpaI aldolase family protein n=1 Tax=Flexithrix dorotheae TaxID=70993 RepID=UPI0003630989|nr:aldolase/citrate lyase family protein [Flexithrix dorotheae]
MSGFQKNDLKQKLLRGEIVYGTCITVNAPRWPDLVANAKLDFVFLDTEHICLDRTELSKMCFTYRALGLTPIVRILQPNPNRASQVMDDGAIGVIAPYLENVDEIKELIGATKFRPLKGKKLKEILAGKAILTPELESYLDRYNHGNLCIANIESIPAVEQLDHLLSMEGLDGVFIGPHDLSINMGIPEQYDHPEFIKTVKTIIHKARKHTLGVGIHFSLEPERQLDWIKEGVNIVIHSSDMALFSQKLKADMAKLKSLDKNQQKEGGTSPSITI